LPQGKTHITKAPIIPQIGIAPFEVIPESDKKQPSPILTHYDTEYVGKV